ncbi:hypothetical protein BGZ96_002290 [Linnemannia gamsii]|uniref:Uncharacterized protein n=1 Tax=Linnemannia gamsii TaxID=64522 RepID=A0ABQ7JL81_9FUNG|nr:hypothetical protein BGZ96_002290 [Linnemannia gamsii]
MLLKHFTFAFVTFAASVHALAIPLNYRRADGVATTGNSGVPVAENAPKVILPSAPAANVVSPASAIPNTDSPAQQSNAPPPPPANNAQLIPATDNTQIAKSTTGTPKVDTTQTTDQSTGTAEANDAQPSEQATDTPEANNDQRTTPNKGAVDTNDSPVSQSAADSATVNNNNTPAPLATTPDAPTPNDIQSQSQSSTPTSSSVQSQTSETDASESLKNQATSHTDPASQVISGLANVPHALVAPAAPSSTEPQAAQAHTPETQVASEPQDATAPAPKAEKQLQSDSEPKIESSPPSADVSTDGSESQSASAEAAKPESPSLPAKETKPEPQPAPVVEDKPKPKPAPAVKAEPEALPAPVSQSAETPENAADSKSVPAVEANPEPQPAPVVEAKPKVEPQPAPVVDKEPALQPAPAAQTKPAPETPLAPASAIECLTLLMKTQQPLTGTCQKLIRDDSTLIQSAELGQVSLDFMYSGKDFPVFSSDGLQLKLQEIPGYTLSVVEARYDVTINYKTYDTASFSAPWATSSMQESTLTTAIDEVDVKVLSSTAFTDLITAMLTKSKTPITLKGTVDINISFPSADGGLPKTVIIAGLQFSSSVHMPGLNGLAQTNFVRSDEYRVYGDTFYFESNFNFVNPSNLKMKLGGVKFDVLDTKAKQLATSAVDVFEIDPKENDVTLRLIANIKDSAAFMNQLHNTGYEVIFQGTTESSTNAYLKTALSQLRFTITYPAVKEIPLQVNPTVTDILPKTSLPVADVPPKTPLPEADIPPQSPAAAPAAPAA